MGEGKLPRVSTHLLTGFSMSRAKRGNKFDLPKLFDGLPLYPGSCNMKYISFPSVSPGREKTSRAILTSFDILHFFFFQEETSYTSRPES